MECNKDEAIRAKEIAEKKMQIGDYVGAQKIALKAQQLYPDLENISQLLMVCEVHCSAANKINGTELDWYGILQIERFSDEAVIKKQYRKLALSLHPDKNKFAGAEAAFKLIGEANRVLCDPMKRPVYDMKCRGAMRPVGPNLATHIPSRNNQADHVKRQHASLNKFPSPPYSQHANAHPHQQPQQATFWTSCSVCGIRYQYYIQYINKMLRCQRCQQNFIACNEGVQGVSPGFAQKGSTNQVPFSVVPQSNGGKPSCTTFKAGSGPLRKAGKAIDDGQTSKTVQKTETNGAEIGGSSKLKTKVNKRVDVEGGKGVPVSQPGLTKAKISGTSKGTARKRGRETVEESSETFDTADSGYNEEDTVGQQNGSNSSAENLRLNGGDPFRRSSRQKQHVSYKENLSDDDFVSPPSKRLKGSRSFPATVDEICGAGEEDLAASASDMVDRNREGKKQQESSVTPKTFELPDTDFSDFDKDKAENCFAVNQLWAIYDTADGMPRYYAWVNKVFSSGFKLEITWLEPSPDIECEKEWFREELPVACGKFTTGVTEVTEDLPMFSHQMCWKGASRLQKIRSNCRDFYFIYPKKGETWALFKDWDVKWSVEAKKHRPPYEYEYVEVIKDFVPDVGIGVSYLGKVAGFVSIYKQACLNGVFQFCIQLHELYRFSHRIPSFRLSGEEGEGVPGGAFELDTAALPFSEVVSYDNVTQAQGTGVSSQVNERPRRPKKQKDTELVADALHHRRSPRDLSKRKSQTEATQLRTGDEPSMRPAADKDDNLGQPSAASSCSTDKIHLHAKEGSSTALSEGSLPSKPRVVEVEVDYSNFKAGKSEDKFETNQVWAILCEKIPVPRDYAVIKKIETKPEFRLHVAMLESCSPQKDTMFPVCFGIFRVKSGKPKVVPISKFSHQINAKAAGRSRYEVYPRKGEIWAVYRNWRTNSTRSDLEFDECDIVEVLEANDNGVRVGVLKCLNGADTFYRAPKTQRPIDLLDIPKAEFARFSHQCHAIQHSGTENKYLRGCWEIDPISLPRPVISLD